MYSRKLSSCSFRESVAGGFCPERKACSRSHRVEVEHVELDLGVAVGSLLAQDGEDEGRSPHGFQWSSDRRGIGVQGPGHRSRGQFLLVDREAVGGRSRVDPAQQFGQFL